MIGEVISVFRDRFFIRPGQPQLLYVYLVEMKDSGLYTCVEGGGLGLGRFDVQLNIGGECLAH